MKYALKVGLLLILCLSLLTNSRSSAETRFTINQGIRILSTESDGIILELNIRDYILEQSLEEKAFVLKIPGANYYKNPGSPELPVFNGLIAIPPDSKVELQILSNVVKSVTGKYPLKFNYGAKPIEEELHPGFLQEGVGINEQGKDLFPVHPVIIGEDAWIRDYHVIRVDFFPFQYNPSSQELVFHQYLRVKIKFNVNSLSFKPNSRLKKDPFQTILQNRVINFSQAKDWIGRPESSNSYFQDIKQTDVYKSPTPTLSQSNPYKLKVSVKKDGIYRVNYFDLLAYGISQVDPNTFHLSSQGKDVAISIENDNGNSVFEPGESILFYGQKYRGNHQAQKYVNENINWLSFSRQLPDGSYDTWKPQLNAKMLEKYTDLNVYWLTWGEVPGPRIASISGSPENAPAANYIRITHRAEEDIRWRSFPFTSEETWFWDRIQTSSNTTRTYTTTLSYPVNTGNPVIIRSEILAALTNDSQSPDHHVQILINDQPLPGFDGQWDGKSRYHFEFSIQSEYLKHGINTFKLNIIPTTNLPNEDLFFDWFEIEYDRALYVNDHEIEIHNANADEKIFTLQSFLGSNPRILDLQDPLLPRWVVDFETSVSQHLIFLPNVQQNGNIIKSTMGNNHSNTVNSYGSYLIKFQGSSTDYIVFDETNVLHPEMMTLVSDKNSLYGPFAEYVYISPAELLPSTQLLANYRENQGFTTRVVNIEDIYNEFNDGIINPIAIKYYLKELDFRGDLPLYVLLVGDGHWNMKWSEFYPSVPLLMPPNLAWADPWQGEVDSANLLATVIGDDPVPDLVIARLPVNSNAEIDDYLDKIKTYEGSPPSTWRYHYLFVADNPDEAGNFYAISDSIIADYIKNPPNYADKIYINLIPGSVVDSLNNTGAIITNYAGHATIEAWASEWIFSTNDIESLVNGNQLSVILSMTCLDGYWIYPGRTSLIELLVRSKDKGAIGAFSPTGLGVASGHDILQRGFYDSLFIDNNWQLGTASISAKLNLFASGSHYDLLNTYTVFGDPVIILPGSS